MQSGANPGPLKSRLMSTDRLGLLKLPRTRPKEGWPLFRGRQPRLMPQDPSAPHVGLHQPHMLQLGQPLNAPSLFRTHGPPTRLDVLEHRFGTRLRQPALLHGVHHVSPNFPLGQGMNAILGLTNPQPCQPRQHSDPLQTSCHGSARVWRSQLHHQDPPEMPEALWNNTPNASRRDTDLDLGRLVVAADASAPNPPVQLSVH